MGFVPVRPAGVAAALAAALVVVAADRRHGSDAGAASTVDPIEQRRSFTLAESGSIGAFSVASGTLADATRTFGPPSETLHRTGIGACKVSWRPLGVTMVLFAPGADPCTTTARVWQAVMRGEGWSTDRRLTIRSDAADVRRLYPTVQAPRARPVYDNAVVNEAWWIGVRPFRDVVFPSLAAELSGSSVTAFVMKAGPGLTRPPPILAPARSARPVVGGRPFRAPPGRDFRLNHAVDAIGADGTRVAGVTFGTRARVWDVGRPTPVVLPPVRPAGEDCEATEVALAGSLLGWVCAGETLSTTQRTIFLARLAPGSRPSAFVGRRAGPYAGNIFSNGDSIVFNTTGFRLWRFGAAAVGPVPIAEHMRAAASKGGLIAAWERDTHFRLLDTTGGRHAAPSLPRLGERGVRLTPSGVVLLRNGELRVYSRSGRLARAWRLQPTYEEPQLLDADGDFAVIRQSPAGDWRGQIRLVRLRDGHSRVLALPAESIVVGAELETTGLFYAHGAACGRGCVSRIAFVPRGVLATAFDRS